jgi:hypothetical protein
MFGFLSMAQQIGERFATLLGVQVLDVLEPVGIGIALVFGLFVLLLLTRLLWKGFKVLDALADGIIAKVSVGIAGVDKALAPYGDSALFRYLYAQAGDLKQYIDEPDDPAIKELTTALNRILVFKKLGLGRQEVSEAALSAIQTLQGFFDGEISVEVAATEKQAGG